MRKLLFSAGAAVAAAALMVNAAFAQSVPDIRFGKPLYDTMPVPSERYDPDVVARLAGFGATIPFWRGQATSGLDGRKYIFDMVGSSPFNAPQSTTIAYVPIVVKVTFPGGVVLDPTKPACNDNVPVERRLFQSPLFTPVTVTSNGVNVGNVQLTDAFQRANFWTAIKGSSAYHVKLASASGAPIVVAVNAPAGSASQAVGGICHRVGLIPLAQWDTIVRSLVTKYAKPNELAIVTTYNVVLFSGTSCCTNGYHYAYMRSGGLQTYAVGTYDDPIYSDRNAADINTWSHELGEWYDDPFVSLDGNNMTPAWGHTGQVSGCQNNLEVGDPLSGAYYAQLGGFRFHPQDLAFLAWFYRFPSIGTGRKFSFEGTFGSAPGACR